MRDGSVPHVRERARGSAARARPGEVASTATDLKLLRVLSRRGVFVQPVDLRGGVF